MKRRMCTVLLTFSLLFSSVLCACNQENTQTKDYENEFTIIDQVGQESKTESIVKGKKVGVAMPTRSSERWLNDGANMKAKLEAIGYEVDLQYAEDDIQAQVSQIDNMILNGADCLVVASIDSTALVDVLQKAKKNGIYVIAYDRLLMNTDAVSYYATFDNKEIGVLIGKYIEDKKHLKEALKNGKSYTIEFFMGSPDDNNAVYLYNGLMEILKPYLDNGVLVCKSNQISFEETCILRWSQDTARIRCVGLLRDYYTDEKLDIACSAFDGFSYGIITALQMHEYDQDQDWPLITGQDAELMAIQNIIDGKQDMSIYKDTRILSGKCVSMVQAVLDGGTPQINDNQQYNNGEMVIPSYLCKSLVIDQENYQEIVIDGGYYTEVQLMKDR
ncbi:MAG: sugar ABC transporter substrate-binding protein [Clostridia bacterium]|nr:sugar ABC transporter substrate-binding protein [Clostridia bacterium]